jgi:hypothetical protein
MADTGAPWNLPYPLDTDLVIDGAQAIEDLAEATADELTVLDSAIDSIPVVVGIGSNVVQTAKTSEFTSTSATFVNITGMTATITPTSASSKILVMFQISGIATGGGGEGGHFRLAGGNTAAYIGDTAGSNTRAIVTVNRTSSWTPTDTMISLVGTYLDAPNTTSAVTYSVQVQRAGAGGSIFINRGNGDTTSDARGRGASSLTVIEVAA